MDWMIYSLASSLSNNLKQMIKNLQSSWSKLEVHPSWLKTMCFLPALHFQTVTLWLHVRFAICISKVCAGAIQGSLKLSLQYVDMCFSFPRYSCHVTTSSCLPLQRWGFPPCPHATSSHHRLVLQECQDHAPHTGMCALHQELFHLSLIAEVWRSPLKSRTLKYEACMNGKVWWFWHYVSSITRLMSTKIFSVHIFLFWRCKIRH